MPQDTKSSDRSSASGNGLVDPSQLLPDQFDSIKVGERDFCDLPNGFPDGDEEMTNKQDTLEPIAVIGIALKFPQDATSPEAFWEMLIQGRSALTEIPRDRFNLDAFWSENSEIAGTVNVRGGHFVKEDISVFDAPFFSINSAEAACMDPQQRWLLETAYHALENSGIPVERLSGSNTSVYIGSFFDEYRTMLSRDPEMRRQYSTTGNGLSLLANRLSWFFNLHGPSLALDTGCSSSLYTLHLACQSLRSGESKMAIVGGCNLFLNPDTLADIKEMNFLSPDGKCYSFDHRANGYARGEGVGLVILKRLSTALQDGDIIRAVVRASGINQDGRTPGITQPSQDSQSNLIRRTYLEGGLNLTTTKYFETHGTGTPVGDPIEATAIHEVFQNSEPLYLGAVKTNIGHLEGASGIAGFIKAILALENGVIPPNIWFERPNPKIPFDLWNLKFPLEATSWPANGLRRASVNSFGYGGANAHVVLDDAYNYLRLRNLSGRHCTRKSPPAAGNLADSPTPDLVNLEESEMAKYRTSPKLLVWSASDEEGISRLASVYHQYFLNLSHVLSDENFLRNLSFTLSERRSKLPWKSFGIFKSIDDLKTIKATLSKPVRSGPIIRLVYIFTGQGAQWPGMGQELLRFPIFRDSLEAANSCFKDLGCRWSLIEELCLNKGVSRLNHPTRSQPICTAVQIALVELLLSWDVMPSTVIGHSSGEIAAAYCIGGLSRESAWKVAYYRGLAVASIEESPGKPGGMMSVGLSEEEVQVYLQEVNDPFEGSISIGCINSPYNVTLSGDSTKINTLEATLKQKGIFAQKLRIGVAAHSKYMTKATFIYSMLIQGVRRGTPLSGNPVMFSTVTGQRMFIEDFEDHTYWSKNMVAPVQFNAAVMNFLSTSLKELGDKVSSGNRAFVDQVIEIGPHGALRSPFQDIMNKHDKGRQTRYSSLLTRGKDAEYTVLNVAGELYCAGYPIQLKALNNNSLLESTSNLVQPTTIPNLPRYPFNHSKKYWQEGRLSRSFRFRKFPHHELLGTPASDWNDLDPKWNNVITPSNNLWVKDHQVNGSIVYPAAGLLVMALQGARQISDITRPITQYRFRDVIFSKALVIPPRQNVELQTQLRPLRDALFNLSLQIGFRVSMVENNTWSELCSGIVFVEYSKHGIDLDDENETDEAPIFYSKLHKEKSIACKAIVNSEQLYKSLAASGLNYGPCFQGLGNVRCNDFGEAIGFVDLHHWMKSHENKTVQHHVIHPAALDSVLQLALPALSRGTKEMVPTIVISKIQNLLISESLSEESSDSVVKIYTDAKFQTSRNASFSIHALNHNNQPCIIGNVEATLIEDRERSKLAEQNERNLCYTMCWKPDFELMDDQSTQHLCSWATESFQSLRDTKDKILVCQLALLKAYDISFHEDFSKAKPHHRKYIEWMKNYLPPHMNNINNTPDLRSESELRHIAQDTVFVEMLHSSLENQGPDGKLLVRVAKNLVHVLRGGVDALDLLFHDGLVDEYYRAYNHENPAISQLNSYMDLLAHKYPDMKVLEIGAGTGATTDKVLHMLTYQGKDSPKTVSMPKFDEYVFTDISPKFFTEAEEKFKPFIQRMTFSVLNIEEDPVLQGFEAGKYDVVIASNVLHATCNLRVTLRNAQKLLRRGGKLILVELVVPGSLEIGFIFGLLPGWWLGWEEIRKWSPLMEEKDWGFYLSQSGFSGVDVSFRDSEDVQRRSFSTMISTVPEADDSPRNLRAIIVASDDSPLQIGLATQLKLHLQRMKISSCEIFLLSAFSSIDFSQTTCIFLTELDRDFLQNISEQDYGRLQRMVSSTRELLWVTGSSGGSAKNPSKDLVLGLSRCLRGENTGLRFVTLALNECLEVPFIVRNILLVWQKAFLASSSRGYEMEYTEIDGLLQIPRVRTGNQADDVYKYIISRIVPKDASQFSLPSQTRGCDELHSETLKPLWGANDIQFTEMEALEVEVRASGLNSTPCSTRAPEYGQEFAGVVTGIRAKGSGFDVGDRVCGFMTDSLRANGRCDPSTTIKVPKDMTFELAASIPVDYCTSYYALFYRAQIRPGESVLIHAGASALGQAALQCAKLADANIYTTVNNEEERNLIMELYDVPARRIFSTRTSTFAEIITKSTSSRGVDIVFNLLNSRTLRAISWDCLASGGRFVEIGVTGGLTFSSLPSNATFTNVDLGYLLHHQVSQVGEIMNTIVNLIVAGKIAPSRSLRLYRRTQLQEAVQSARIGTSGKIVIRDADEVALNPSSTLQTCDLDPDATYLISGGLGGIGCGIARWMVNRNAKNLILLSRSGAISHSAQNLLEELESRGINVATPKCDISKLEMLVAALKECNKIMPPIKGCIQAAMALEDGQFKNMPYKNFMKALAPKTTGSWNLHTLLPSLDFFVILSSLSGIVGLSDQANYACGNTYQDALARYRLARDQRSIALDLGMMADLGHLASADASNIRALLKAGGFSEIRELEFLALLDYYCDIRRPLPSPQDSQLLIGLQIPAYLLPMEEREGMYWAKRPIFGHLSQMRSSSHSANDDDKASKLSTTLEAQIRVAHSLQEVFTIMAEALKAKLEATLGVAEGDIGLESLMVDLGIDSLVAIEIRTWLRRNVGVDMSVWELLGANTLTDLVASAVEKSRYLSEGLRRRKALKEEGERGNGD